MSMPSSRLRVATRAGRRPAFSSSSISRRCSLAMLPWWARTSSSPASSLRRWASRSASRRLLVNTIVLRCWRISSRIRGWMAGQMLVRSSPPTTGPPGCSSIGRTSPRRAMSSTGTTTWSSSGFLVPASTMLTSRPSPTPPRYRAMVSRGRWVALRPMRWIRGRSSPASLVAAVPRRRSRRSRLSARWAPRLVPAIAWTSSTITCSTPLRISLAWLVEQEVEALGGGDEDVRRVADEVAALVGRRVAGSEATEMLGGWSPRRAASWAMPARGARRLRSTSYVSALSGLTYRTRTVPGCSLGGGRPRVLDEPVEAPQERGERLAAAGRGVDQRVPALGDRRPALGLRRRRGLERRLEPGPDSGPERGKRIGLGRDHGTPSIEPTSHFDQMFGSFARFRARNARRASL